MAAWSRQPRTMDGFFATEKWADVICSLLMCQILTYIQSPSLVYGLRLQAAMTYILIFGPSCYNNVRTSRGG
jgi:hypothetical protein